MAVLNVTELRLVGTAHPKADQAFRRFAEAYFSANSWQCFAALADRVVTALSGRDPSLAKTKKKGAMKAPR